MAKKNQKFCSPLGKYFQLFINTKRSFGYKYQEEENQLLRLDKFLIREGLREVKFPKSFVEKWLVKSSTESNRNHFHRISITRLIVDFLLRHNVPAFYPSKHVIKRIHEYIPYIFSHEEIRKLFTSADILAKTTRKGSIMSLMPVILRFLYSTGMRSGELTRLKWCDVNLKSGVVKVFQGKRRKDRLLPLSTTMHAILKKYAVTQHDQSPENPVFISNRGKPCNNRRIYAVFRLILHHAKIPHRGRGKGPRVHDFRHTFAVHNLEKWLSGKKDLNVHLSILVDYLGHDSMESTQHYLQILPAIYPEIVSRIENSVGKKLEEVFS